MQSFSCKCQERKKPVRERNWRVINYRSRCSAFDGYKTMRSDYSDVECNSCGSCGRTKAGFVDTLYFSQRHPL